MVQQLTICPIRQRALRHPDVLAIKAAQRSLSYRELDQQISAIEQQLSAQGLKAGDRLVCIAPNSLELILLQLSCMRSAVIFCPLNPRFSEQEIATRLAILDSDFIWSKQSRLNLPLSALAFDFSYPKNIEQPSNELALDAQRVINIIFTSGSSGQPKAVMHNFSNHFYSALGSKKLIPLGNGDRNLLSLPIFHISGYATVFRTFQAGACLVLSDEKLTITLLKEQQISHLSLVSTQLYRLLENPEFTDNNLHIKHLLLGGSAFSEQLLQQTGERGFNYHLSYGLTEMSSQVATSCNNQTLSILNDREVKIVNGEILLRGKTRFVGYFNHQQENCIIPEKQWFASKDLGKKNAEQLQIIGRKDRQFICFGENIQPEEIEGLLVNATAVKQAYVVAINDPTLGQCPVAFIEWQSEQPKTEQLNHYMHSQLASFKCPIHYFPLPPQKGFKVSLADLQKHATATLLGRTT